MIASAAGVDCPSAPRAAAGRGWRKGLVWVFLRFTLSAALPSNATVTSATLRLWGTTIFSWNSSVHALRVRAELSADAAPVTSRDHAPELVTTGRPLSSQSVRWPASGGLTWQFPAWNTSPELNPLVQELIDTHGGLAAGAHVQLWIDGAFSDDNGEVGLEDYSDAATHNSELRLTWGCP